MPADRDSGTSGTRPSPRVAAEHSIARRFSRVMRACTTPWGVLSDPPIIAFASAFSITVALYLYRYAEQPWPTAVLVVIAAVPLGVGVVSNALLMGARGRVIEWLAGLPFPVQNVNALLNGVAYRLQVRFQDSAPSRSEFNEVLEAVHPDCFALEYADDEPVVEVHVGVLESKLNPARSNHKRYVRVRKLVEEGLVPLCEDHPIEGVWIG